jgi:teichuronic acid biosynthesis glycosyltransferase TuaC
MELVQISRKGNCLKNMKVLFVCSGNKPSGINHIVENQGKGLTKTGIRISYFLISGKGFRGYIKNIPELKRFAVNKGFDIIHAHYSYSCFLASLAGLKPLVVSLMGSDANSNPINKFIIRSFCFLFGWESIIVKSDSMKKKLGIKNAEIIPNGVDPEHFKPMWSTTCKERLGWDVTKKHILFAANPKRPEKNFKLSSDAFHLIDDKTISLHVLEDVPYSEMPVWMNAADVIVLSSLWEGSPNVIKEAMACNRPIVSTDVGDVKNVIGNAEGCYIAEATKTDIAEMILKALEFKESKDGRQRIIDLGLYQNTISGKILKVYQEVIKR